MCDDTLNKQKDNDKNEDIKINPKWMMHLEKGAKIKKDKKQKTEEREENS